MFKFQWPWYRYNSYLYSSKRCGISNRSTNNPKVRSKLNPWEFPFYDVLRYTRILLSNIVKSKLNICSSLPKGHYLKMKSWWPRCLFVFFHAETSSVINNFVFTVPYVPLAFVAFVSGILFLWSSNEAWLTTFDLINKRDIRMLPVVTIRDENCSKHADGIREKLLLSRMSMPPSHVRTWGSSYMGRSDRIAPLSRWINMH